MEVVRNQCPGIATSGCNSCDLNQSGEEILPVSIVSKNISALNPPANDVMQRSWQVDPRLSRHMVSPLSKNLIILYASPCLPPIAPVSACVLLSRPCELTTYTTYTTYQRPPASPFIGFRQLSTGTGSITSLQSTYV
jgi:hypothetical protein